MPENENAAGKEEARADAGQKPEPGKKQRESSGKAAQAAPEQEDYRDKWLRAVAEFDNYKKRVKSDNESAKAIGKAELVKSMLPVLDEFELAVASADASPDRGLVKGIEMVYSNFIETLKRCGLAELPAKGMFDPYRHEAVMAREDALKPGTILEVVKKGYTFEGNLLRPASVIIAKEKGPEEDKNQKK